VHLRKVSTMTLQETGWNMSLNEFAAVCMFIVLLLSIGIIVILSPLSWLKSLIPVFVTYTTAYFVFERFVLRTTEQNYACIVILVFVSLLFGHQWQRYAN